MTAPAVERPALRRPRLWHALVLSTAAAWALATLINPDCEAPSLTPPPAVVEPDTNIKASDYMPGMTSEDLTWCEVLHPSGGAGLIECGVGDGVLKKSALDRIENTYAAQERAAAEHEAQQTRADSVVRMCRGQQGQLADLLTWLALGLLIASAVVGWRRARAYSRHKRDCATASAFARRFPPEHIELASNSDLDQVIPAAFAASAEALSQRVSWFGGNAEEDTRRAYALREIAQIANGERQRRLGGGWVHGAPGAGDLPEPKLPPAPQNATPTAPSDWRSKLSATDEDW